MGLHFRMVSSHTKCTHTYSPGKFIPGVNFHLWMPQQLPDDSRQAGGGGGGQVKVGRCPITRAEGRQEASYLSQKHLSYPLPPQAQR